MLAKTLKCVALLSCCAVALAGVSAPAGDTKAKAGFAGVWGIQGGEMKLDFSAKETMKAYPHGENEVIVLVCQVSAGKGGEVRAKVTAFEGKDKAKEKLMQLIPLGTEFSFRWQVKEGTATLDNVAGKDVPELLKSHLEGKYDKK
jgi:hypothetical protein